MQSIFSSNLFAPTHLIQLLEEGGNMMRGVPLEVEDMRNLLKNIREFTDSAAEDGDIMDEIETRDKKQLREAAFLVEDVIDEYMICEERRPPDPGCAALSCEIVDFIKTMILRHQIKSMFKNLNSQFRETVNRYFLVTNSCSREERCSVEISNSSRREKSSRETKNSTRQMKCQEAPPYMDEADTVCLEAQEQERCSVEISNSSRREKRSRETKNSTRQMQMKCLHEAPPYMDEADIVGFEAPSAKLIDWLINERQERVVVCVVGMTGIGKTILANTVYSNKKVIGYFDCTVWIQVSQFKTVEELFMQLLYNIYKQKGDNPPEDVFEMDQPSLTIEVRNCLHQKRYAVFLDNICHTHFWSEIESALPDNMNGSRIFITTTNIDVAVYCKRRLCVEVHEMQPLTLAKSLELFNKKAFFDFGGNCPENLKDISLEIVKKCKGLPLAIVAIGSALSVKERNSLQWKSFSENLHSEMIHNIHVSVITSLFCMDYDNLPSFLKPCLLYFAIYPEDYEIKSNRLIRQWIAEGFIEQKNGKTLEEVAEGYLDELINRRLVQKSYVSILGKVKGCRIHDLSFVVLRRKAKDLSFCKFVTDHDKSVNGIIRRLSIATTSNDLIENIESSHVRSLLFFAEDELLESLVKGIPTKYKLLKVLDFENARLLDVPENLGDLIHLKYLSFRNTDIQSIPKSIGKLQNLETLDLRQTDVNELPKEISKLRKLQHLLGKKMSLIHLKGVIGGMESLQTLSEVRIDDDGIELITEMGKLTQLRKLSLFDVREEHGISLCSSINEMQHLEKLYIEAKSEDATIDLSFVSCPTMLQKFRLKAKLNKLPKWIPKLENLVELSMSYSQLTEDPLESLQNLPSLLVLNLLVRSYEGESLHFQGGFQNLKELGLRYLSNVESIIIEQGALPSLKELTFMNIPNLKMAPSGIQYLLNLEVLNTYFMPTAFEKSIAPSAQLIEEK